MAANVPIKSVGPPPVDRRARHRQATIDEILEISRSIMTEEGVNGLSLSEVARRLGVKQPSLYKYFSSRMEVYDELFLRGQRDHLEVMRAAMAVSRGGLDALISGLEASGRWCLAHRAMAELLFWRPVPRFEPSSEAMSVSQAMIDIQREAIREAVAAGELGPRAQADETIYLISIMIMGVITQALANEPDLTWGTGRFTPWFSRLMGLLSAAFPPDVVIA